MSGQQWNLVVGFIAIIIIVGGGLVVATLLSRPQWFKAVRLPQFNLKTKGQFVTGFIMKAWRWTWNHLQAAARAVVKRAKPQQAAPTPRRRRSSWLSNNLAWSGVVLAIAAIVVKALTSVATLAFPRWGFIALVLLVIVATLSLVWKNSWHPSATTVSKLPVRRFLKVALWMGVGIFVLFLLPPLVRHYDRWLNGNSTRNPGSPQVVMAPPPPELKEVKETACFQLSAPEVGESRTYEITAGVGTWTTMYCYPRPRRGGAGLYVNIEAAQPDARFKAKDRTGKEYSFTPEHSDELVTPTEHQFTAIGTRPEILRVTISWSLDPKSSGSTPEATEPTEKEEEPPASTPAPPPTEKVDPPPTSTPEAEPPALPRRGEAPAVMQARART